MALVALLESLLFPNFENCPNSKKGSLKRLILGWLVDVAGIAPATRCLQSIGLIPSVHPLLAASNVSLRAMLKAVKGFDSYTVRAQ
jgi:hypothetical protein